MNKKIPRRRFPGFADDWEQRKFGDVGSVSMCKRVFKEETSPDGDIPFFKIGTFGGKPDAFISRELFENYKIKYSYPDDGDILLSASGTIGRIVEYKGEEAYFQDSNIVWLSHDKTVNNKFLKVLYPTVKWDGIEGSTIQRLYNDNFLRTRFMMPSFEEQEKLGQFFGQLDNLITLHQRKLDVLKEYKKGFLQKMFPQQGETIPEIRFPGFADDWEQRKLVELYESACSGGTPKSSVERYYEGDIPFLGIADIDGRIVNDTKKHISEDGLNNSTAVMIPSGTISLAMYASVGKVGITGVPMATSQAFYNMTFSSVPTRDFVYTLLEKMELFSEWEPLISTGTQRNLNADKVKNLVIRVPSEEERKQIGLFFQSLDNTITLHQRKLDKYKELKNGLLQQMFV